MLTLNKNASLKSNVASLFNDLLKRALQGQVTVLLSSRGRSVTLPDRQGCGRLSLPADVWRVEPGSMACKGRRAFLRCVLLSSCEAAPCSVPFSSPSDRVVASAAYEDRACIGATPVSWGLVHPGPTAVQAAYRAKPGCLFQRSTLTLFLCKGCFCPNMDLFLRFG